MRILPDDPIIQRIERTGFAPWVEEDLDEEEHCNDCEPFAVYDPAW